jgi:hypothetical protein
MNQERDARFTKEQFAFMVDSKSEIKQSIKQPQSHKG